MLNIEQARQLRSAYQRELDALLKDVKVLRRLIKGYDAFLGKAPEQPK